MQKYGLFQPSVYHALIVIFLEFFSWGLVMSPVITVCSAYTFSGFVFTVLTVLQLLHTYDVLCSVYCFRD